MKGQESALCKPLLELHVLVVETQEPHEAEHATHETNDLELETQETTDLVPALYELTWALHELGMDLHEHDELELETHVQKLGLRETPTQSLPGLEPTEVQKCQYRLHSFETPLTLQDSSVCCDQICDIECKYMRASVHIQLQLSRRLMGFVLCFASAYLVVCLSFARQ